LLVALLGDVGDHHARSLAGERQGRRTADAVRGPGHERDLAREIPLLVDWHRPLRLTFLGRGHVAPPAVTIAERIFSFPHRGPGEPDRSPAGACGSLTHRGTGGGTTRPGGR